MTLFDRISELAKKQHIGLKDLAIKIGLSESAIYQWRTSSPKAETLQKVADYFDVSTDYLLGRIEDPAPLAPAKRDFADILNNNLDKEIVKSKEEEDLLVAFRLESEDMSEEEKKKFNNSLKGMMKIAKGLLNDDSKWKD